MFRKNDILLWEIQGIPDGKTGKPITVVYGLQMAAEPKLFIHQTKPDNATAPPPTIPTALWNETYSHPIHRPANYQRINQAWERWITRINRQGRKTNIRARIVQYLRDNSNEIRWAEPDHTLKDPPQ